MKKQAKKPFVRVESHLEEKLLICLNRFCLLNHLPYPVRDKALLKGSNLEFDFAWPNFKIAIEVQGGIKSRGRRSGHVSIGGMYRDIYKLNLAQSQGWILLQFPPEYCTQNDYWEKMASWFLLLVFEQRRK